MEPIVAIAIGLAVLGFGRCLWRSYTVTMELRVMQQEHERVQAQAFAALGSIDYVLRDRPDVSSALEG